MTAPVTPMATKPITDSAFTPGPWRLSAGSETTVFSHSGAVNVAEARCGGIGGPRVAEAEANARLIVAAPDLLDALYQYRNDLRYPPAADSIERRLVMIENLIAKAGAA